MSRALVFIGRRSAFKFQQRRIEPFSFSDETLMFLLERLQTRSRPFQFGLRSGSGICLRNIAPGAFEFDFRTAAGAAGYVAYGRRARGGDRAYSALRLTSVPGAAAYQATHAGGTTRVVLFASGRSAFLLGIQGTLPAGAAGDLAVLARLQLAAAG